ncbi:MAG TPA: sigma-70 family RNA polymerase sigma factor [Prosthecobacter sp.]
MPDPLHALSPEFVQQISAAQSSLYAFILTLMAGQDGAADVLQETNLKLCREWHRYDTSRPFLPWAVTLARFEVMAWRTRHQRSRLVLDNDVVDLMAEDISEAQSDRELVALESCMSTLPARQRELVSLRYDRGDTVRAIARRLGQPENALAALFYRIRKALHDCMTARLSQEDFA